MALKLCEREPTGSNIRSAVKSFDTNALNNTAHKHTHTDTNCRRNQPARRYNALVDETYSQCSHSGSCDRKGRSAHIPFVEACHARRARVCVFLCWVYRWHFGILLSPSTSIAWMTATTISSFHSIFFGRAQIQIGASSFRLFPITYGMGTNTNTYQRLHTKYFLPRRGVYDACVWMCECACVRLCVTRVSVCVLHACSVHLYFFPNVSTKYRRMHFPFNRNDTDFSGKADYLLLLLRFPEFPPIHK